MTISRLAGLVVAAVAAAAGLVGVTTVPASAALCSAGGVNVVVDFHGLGGGVQKGCDPNGANKSSDKVFEAAGFQLSYAQRQPGFVCRVNGKSPGDPCVNTSPDNAYWGLYWSNGTSGKWTYATTGVSGLSVPKGGFVAFSWQNGGAADPPGAAPVNKQSTPAPTPTPRPTKAPPTAPSGGAGGSGGGGSKPTKAAEPAKAAGTSATAATPTPAPSAAARAAAKAKAKAKARARASARPSAGATPSAGASESVSPPTGDDSSAAATQKASGEFTPEEQDSGLPVWVPIVVLLGLGGAAGGAVWWRRRTGAA